MATTFQPRDRRVRVAFYGGAYSPAAKAALDNAQTYALKKGLQPSDNRTISQATVDQTISAVVQKRADRAVLPFFNSHKGYVAETVSALSRTLAVTVVGEEYGDDKYVLAVPTEHMAQREQSRFGPKPNSSFNPVTKLLNPNKQANRRKFDEAWSRQLTEIHVTPEAERACSHFLANYSAEGVSIRSLDSDRAALRQFLDSAASALDQDRVVESLLNADGRMELRTTFTGRARRQPVYGVVLPWSEAQAAEDAGELQIIDAQVEDGDAVRERFVVIERRGASDAARWPFDVVAWDGRARGVFGNSVKLTGFWNAPWRQWRGSALITRDLIHGYPTAAGKNDPTLRLIVASAGVGRKAPIADDVERFARRNELGFETGAARIGDASPVRVFEIDFPHSKRSAIKAFIKQIRTADRGRISVLGGYYTDEPCLEWVGGGRTRSEKLNDLIG